MILSHKYKFIFLRTCKTASSALQIALSRHCGPDDIITPDLEKDERLKIETGGRPAQHYEGPIPITNRRYWRRRLRGDPKPKFFTHIQARDVKAYIPPDIWESYFKFAFERDPWDKAISLYYWRYQKTPRPSFYEFIKKGRLAKTLRRQGRGIYRIRGRIAVDRVCLYEDMDRELEILRQKTGLPALELPHAKNTQRKDRRPYTEVIAGKERDMIARICAPEIETFGYRFGDQSAIRPWPPAGT